MRPRGLLCFAKRTHRAIQPLEAKASVLNAKAMTATRKISLMGPISEMESVSINKTAARWMDAWGVT